MGGGEGNQRLEKAIIENKYKMSYHTRGGPGGDRTISPNATTISPNATWGRKVV